MKLIHGERATIRLDKLTDYILNPDHPVGKHKARLFARLLGITLHNPQPLLDALSHAAEAGDAFPGKVDLYGERYTVDFTMPSSSKIEVTVRSAWIVRENAPPDLVTCFIL